MFEIKKYKYECKKEAVIFFYNFLNSFIHRKTLVLQHLLIVIGLQYFLINRKMFETGH